MKKLPLGSRIALLIGLTLACWTVGGLCGLGMVYLARIVGWIK